MIIIVNFLLCFCEWIMIYYAHLVYPIIQPFEDKNVIAIRDRMACNNIIAKDDILLPKDLSLFMKVLHILDFLYYTALPALATCLGLYILRLLNAANV